MSKLGLANLVMFILLLILGSAIYFSPAPQPQEQAATVTQLLPAQVTHILLQRQQQEEVRLEKEEEHWLLHYHQQRLPANSWRVGNLLKLLQARSEQRFQSDDLAQYGLEPARAKIQFNDQWLLIGDNDPIKRLRYIAHDGAIMLVTDQYYLHLFASLTDYLSPAPLELLPPIRDILINGHQPELHGDDRQQWLDNWQHLQALQVRASDPGFKAKQQITLQPEEGAAVTLQRQGNLLRDPKLNLVYELSDASLGQLFPKP